MVWEPHRGLFMHYYFLTGSDIQKLCIGCERAVGISCEDLLGELLAELHAFLIEGVQVPDEALEHDLVLEVRKQCAERFGRQLIADDDGGRTVACKVLVRIFIILAAGEGHDLRYDIGTELLLGSAVLDDDVGRHLALAEADELQRDDIGALVQELIEAVLSVGAGLTEDNGAGLVLDPLSEAVYGFSVRLHVCLLQMSGET